MIDYNLTDINGYEIIDFLNSDPNGELQDADTCVYFGSFKFERQELRNNIFYGKEQKPTYVLGFTAGWDNWGECFTVKGINEIFITKNEVWVSLYEPLSDDGTDQIISSILKEWLPTHKFKKINRDMFTNIIRDVQDKISVLDDETLSGSVVNSMIEEVIKDLKGAKKYIKIYGTDII